MILCLGTTPVLQRSMVFERVVPDAVNRAASAHDYASGKSVNVARVLHTLGHDTVALGFAGGCRGVALLDDLRRSGIDYEFVDTPGAATRQCVTVIDRQSGTATELVEESAPVAADHWPPLLAKVRAHGAEARACVFSGSLPPGAPQDFYLTCLQSVPAGIPVVVDARGEPLRHALRHPGFVAKLNREELAATVGGPVDSEDQLRRAVRQIMPEGGSVVVTSGRGGVFASRVDRLWRIHPPTVAARSAVGSGDAFAAGLVLGLLRGDALPQACALGAACGAANALTDLAGHLAPADVERLLPQVRVEAL
jgi:tagatose 6-phosphate kinase